jgi:hypothetical protein
MKRGSLVHGVRQENGKCLCTQTENCEPRKARNTRKGRGPPDLEKQPSYRIRPWPQFANIPCFRVLSCFSWLIPFHFELCIQYRQQTRAHFETWHGSDCHSERSEESRDFGYDRSFAALRMTAKRGFEIRSIHLSSSSSSSNDGGRLRGGVRGRVNCPPVPGKAMASESSLERGTGSPVYTSHPLRYSRRTRSLISGTLVHCIF